MKTSTIYVEFDTPNQHILLYMALQTLVEKGQLSGFFTLTNDGRAVKQPRHRPDLALLAENIAIYKAVEQ
jgi:hypothetical protein